MTPPAGRGQRGAREGWGAEEDQDPITSSAKHSLWASCGVFSRQQRWWKALLARSDRQWRTAQRDFSRSERAKQEKRIPSLSEVKSDTLLLDTYV